MTGEEREGLPPGWVETTLGEVVEYGRTEKAEPHEIPPGAWVLELEDIEKDSSKILQRLTFEQRESKSTKNRFAAGDVLYGKLRPYLNKVALADNDGYCTTEIVPIKSGETLDSRFIYYWLKHPEFLRYVGTVSHGMNMPRLGTDAGKEAPFVLAPLPEQIRIADKLDALPARVEAGRERLERVPKLVKQFRQAVLSAAVSGELTREWRGGGDVEWPAMQLRDCASDFSYGSAAKSSKTGTVPVLRMGNIQSGLLIWDDLVYTSDQDEIQKYKLQAGDVLFNRTNSPDLVGKTTVYKGERPAIYAGYLIRVKCRPELLPDYLNYCLNSKEGRDYCWQVKTDGVSQSNINAQKLRDFPILLPPLLEQTEIVRRVEALFAIADRLEARYKAALTSFDRLTPALLAKAFRGELVPQDPNDEPASVLLERIRTQRASEGTKSGRGRKAAPKPTGQESSSSAHPPKAHTEGTNGPSEPKRRGRPPKAQAIPSVMNEEEAIRLLEERHQARSTGTRQVSLFEPELQED